MYEYTKLVDQAVWEKLLKLLPTPRQKRYGRRRCSKEALLNGILQVLVNGVSWGKIAYCGCSYVSCYRYLKELQRRKKLKLVFQILVESIDLRVGSIDTTTVLSFEFRYCVAWDGFNKVAGTKISLFSDQYGLPVDVSFGKGKREDKSFLPEHIKNTKGKVKKVINLDMKYMSLKLRREMRKKGIRVNMKVRTQDYKRKRGPKFKLDLKIYNTRFKLERTNGWIKNFKRLRLRREYNIAMFKAFVYLALLIILLRS